MTSKYGNLRVFHSAENNGGVAMNLYIYLINVYGASPEGGLDATSLYGWSSKSKTGGWYKFYRGFCVEISLANSVL